MLLTEPTGGRLKTMPRTTREARAPLPTILEMRTLSTLKGFLVSALGQMSTHAWGGKGGGGGGVRRGKECKARGRTASLLWPRPPPVPLLGVVRRQRGQQESPPCRTACWTAWGGWQRGRPGEEEEEGVSRQRRATGPLWHGGHPQAAPQRQGAARTHLLVAKVLDRVAGELGQNVEGLVAGALKAGNDVGRGHALVSGGGGVRVGCETKGRAVGRTTAVGNQEEKWSRHAPCAGGTRPSPAACRRT